MKDIVIIAHFVGGGVTGKNRFMYIANRLSESANVELITSDFSHGTKERKKQEDVSTKYKMTLLHEPGYPTNVCLQRFYSHAILGKNVRKYLKNRKKPDVIYCAVPSLDVACAAAKYAKEKKVRFIIDVQDLWPEAFKMVFNIPIISELIFKPMEKLADSIYAQADEIIAVSKSYVDRAMKVNNKCKNPHAIFLGTRLLDFDNNVKCGASIKLTENRLKLAYCGTLGRSYDLLCVFDALRILKNNNQETPIFIVMGDGPRKKEFEEYAEKYDIDVLFTGRLEYSEMCALLCECDIVVNPIVKGSAGSIINKHADYAASGLPVLNTQECDEYRELVEVYDMGYNCINGDATDLADKMLVLLKDDKLRSEKGKNARRCAEERFDRENSYAELFEVVAGKEK